MEHEATGGAKQAVGSVSSAAAQGFQTHKMSGEHSTANQIEQARVSEDIALAKQAGKEGESASVTAKRAEQYTQERHEKEEKKATEDKAKKAEGTKGTHPADLQQQNLLKQQEREDKRKS